MWWSLSSRTQHEKSAGTYPESNVVIEATEPEPLVSRTPAFDEGQATVVTSDDATVVSAPPEPAAWRASALAFANQDDADPTLSRHLEAEMQKLIDTTLDRARYDPQSVTCRLNRCQVIASDRALSVDSNSAPVSRLDVVTGGPMSVIVPPIVLGASNAGILDPYSGASLKAELERAQSFRTELPAIEIIIAFAGL